MSEEQKDIITNPKIEIIESGKIVINHGVFGIEKTGVHRLIVIINGRKFKRLLDPYYPVVWSEENQIGFMSKDKTEQLESILKAYIMDMAQCKIEEYELENNKKELNG